MDQENDVSYYRRREEAARALADRSTDPAIRTVHSEMAAQYSAKVRAATLTRT